MSVKSVYEQWRCDVILQTPSSLVRRCCNNIVYASLRMAWSGVQWSRVAVRVSQYLYIKTYPYLLSWFKLRISQNSTPVRSAISLYLTWSKNYVTTTTIIKVKTGSLHSTCYLWFHKIILCDVEGCFSKVKMSITVSNFQKDSSLFKLMHDILIIFYQTALQSKEQIVAQITVKTP